MATRDHFADDPGAQHLGIDIAKVCSLLAQGSAKPVDDDDIAHGELPHQASNSETLLSLAARCIGPFSVADRNTSYTRAERFASGAGWKDIPQRRGSG